MSAPIAERRAIVPLEEPTQRALWQATLRALAAANLVSPADANALFMRVGRDEELLQREPLQAAMAALGKAGAEDAERAAGALTASGHPVPLCDFPERAERPNAFYTAHPPLRALLERFHAVLLWATETEQFATLVVGTPNPIAGGMIADYLRTNPLPSGRLPYVGLMRVSTARWQDIAGKHFPSVAP